MTSTASVSGSDQAFLGAAALLFVASAATTIVWCASMSAMGGMPMPGGWTMSMAWMRMPGQSWVDAAAMFLGMWFVMMVAMMLPSLVPMLWRYRQAVATTGETRLGRLTVFVSIGYFFVWTVIGAVVFSIGAAVSAIVMSQPAAARAMLRLPIDTVFGSEFTARSAAVASSAGRRTHRAHHGSRDHRDRPVADRAHLIRRREPRTRARRAELA